MKKINQLKRKTHPRFIKHQEDETADLEGIVFNEVAEEDLVREHRNNVGRFEDEEDDVVDPEYTRLKLLERDEKMKALAARRFQRSFLPISDA